MVGLWWRCGGGDVGMWWVCGGVVGEVWGCEKNEFPSPLPPPPTSPPSAMVTVAMSQSLRCLRTCVCLLLRVWLGWAH